MIKREITYIGRESWEKTIRDGEHAINTVCAAILIFAILYFGPICLTALWR